MQKRPKPRSKPKKARPGVGYVEALERFSELEDSYPEEAVLRNPAVFFIAKTFGKTLDKVAADINRRYLKSYRRSRCRIFNLLPPDWD
jgi:hypothetical protein